MLIQTYGQYTVPLDAEGHLGLTKAYVHKDNLLLSGCKCHWLDCQDIPTLSNLPRHMRLGLNN